jgi:ribosomal protein S18 acetylase RimI-like enzyme
MSRVIEPLLARHQTADFTCGKESLDRYLHKHAVRNQQLGYGRTYVAISSESPLQIDGYYTISMSSVQFTHLPEALQFAGMPKYPMPVAHLGCLAVRSSCQGQGLGNLLLIDAMSRMISGAQIVAARAIEVVALDERVAQWYATFGFKAFKDAPLHLFLPLDTARQIVDRSAP